MSSAYIISAVRAPIGIGKPDKGILYSLEPVQLAARVLKAAVERGGVDPRHVQDVILGCVTPIGDQGANIGRLSALQAGFPVEVPGLQINRMCGSGQQAVHFAAQAILAGDADLVLAGGIEMMSHQPLGRDYPDSWPEEFPYELVHQGISAERMASEWNLTRKALDDFAYRSHILAGAAIREGRFDTQIIPIRLPGTEYADVPLGTDQGVRMEPDRAAMANLQPVFDPDGVITAGNSSQISDGAAALLLASERAVRELNLAPRAIIRTRVVVGSDPVLMLSGPIPATRMALDRSGLAIRELDAIEINEAFAPVVLAWQAELEPDPDLVNPNGGAIAHGHPLGATGAILMTKLLYELERVKGRFGLQTMCIGHGMATATIIERL